MIGLYGNWKREVNKGKWPGKKQLSVILYLQPLSTITLCPFHFTDFTRALSTSSSQHISSSIFYTGGKKTIQFQNLGAIQSEPLQQFHVMKWQRGSNIVCNTQGRGQAEHFYFSVHHILLSRRDFKKYFLQRELPQQFPPEINCWQRRSRWKAKVVQQVKHSSTYCVRVKPTHQKGPRGHREPDYNEIMATENIWFGFRNKIDSDDVNPDYKRVTLVWKTWGLIFPTSKNIGEKQLYCNILN